MEIKNDEHVFICGMTRSGKTHFAKFLYSGFKKTGHFIIIDVKHELQLMNAVTVYRVQDIEPNLNAGKNVIARVEPTQENYDAIAIIALRRGNTKVWIEDSAQVIAEGKITQPYINLYTIGASRNSTCWSLVQRPALISKTAMSQSAHYFIFALMSNKDRKAICEDVPIDIKNLAKLKKRWHYHYQQGDEKAKLYSPI